MSGTQQMAGPGGRLLSRRARVLLVAALVAVVGMAFRVSWNALRDVAVAIGADPDAATLYPVVVDGLMALALVATLVLTGRDRAFALRVLAGYTAASLALNYVHGLVPGLHGLEDGQRVALAGWSAVHWALVLVASSLPVGAIFFGSDLVARVLHHRPESTPTEDERSGAEQAQRPAPIASTPAPELTPTAPTVDPDRAPSSSPQSTPTERPTPRPRRSTGPVPAAAKSARPARRTLDELLAEARQLSTSDQQSAEQIRQALRIGSPRAREIRELLAAERDQSTGARSLRSVPAPDPTDVHPPLLAASN
jgi:hypothetical protein